MRLACLFVEHLLTRSERLARQELYGLPIVVLRSHDEHVLDASPKALAAGVSPGDTRLQVERRCPEAVIVLEWEWATHIYPGMLGAVVSKFARPVKTEDWGPLYIDIDAVIPHFPSEQALALALITQAGQAAGLNPAVGIAASLFTVKQAALAAIQAKDRIVVVPEQSEGHFRAALPLTALPNPPAEMVRRLKLFGITMLGGIAELPYAAFVMQFGPKLAVYHKLARGMEEQHLTVQRHYLALAAQTSHREPVNARRARTASKPGRG
jgi:nucleotidyltransferase/DNA polymerase involved in DNA repair